MELITERGRVDCYDTFTWSLNYKSAEILDLKGRKASYSRTIKVPYTRTNRAIWEGLDEWNVDNVGYDTKTSLKCFISHNGRVLMSGTVQVLQLDETKEEKTVELQVIASVKDLVTKLKRVNLNEMDFTRWNHDYTADNIYNNIAWNRCQLDEVQVQVQQGQGYTYPLVDFGKDDTLGETSWSVDDLRPSLYLKEYIDTLFRFAGLTYTSDFFESGYFRSICLLNTKSILEFTQEQKDAYSASILMDTNFATGRPTMNWTIGQAGYNSIQNQDEWYYLPINSEIDPLDQWFTVAPTVSPTTLNLDSYNGNRFTCEKTGTYRFNINLEYYDEWALDVWGDDPFFAAYLQSLPIGQTVTYALQSIITERFIEVIKNDVTYEPLSVLAQGLNSISYTGNYPSGAINWQNDGVLKQSFFEVTIDLEIGDTIAIRTFEPQKGTLDPDDVGYVVHRWNFENIDIRSELIDATVSAGDEINFLNYVPNIKADVFVDAVFNLFNLWVIDDVFNPDNLIIEPRINFFDSGGYVDMSKKLDLAQTINADYLADKLPQFYKYIFKTSSDNANVTWNNQNSIGYADFDSEVDIDFTNKEQKITTAFSPLIVQEKNGLYYPQEYGLNNLEKSTLGASLKLGFMTKQSGDWELRDELGGTQSLNEYWQIAEFDSITNPNYSLTYGTPSPFIPLNKSAYWNLWNLFHSLTEEEQTRSGSKEIVAYFNLNENDIAELDLRRAWFVNGVYFRLIEIAKFNPLSNGTTKVRLLQIETPFFDFTSNEIIYSNAFKNNPNSRVLATTSGELVKTKNGYVLINGN